MLRILTKDEVIRLVNAPDMRLKDGARDRAFLMLMARCGLRIAEACALRVEDVKTAGALTRITFIGKGRKIRTVTLTPDVAETLHKVLAGRKGQDFVFHGRAEKNALTVRGGRFIFYQYRDTVGLGPDVHPHTMRHTFATMLLRATNGDIRTVQRTLGHSSPTTTIRHYDGWDSRDSDRAALAMEAAI